MLLEFKVYQLKKDSDMYDLLVEKNNKPNEFDIENFPLSNKIQEELFEWVSEYGEWIDLETDSLKENGLKLQANHNEKGLKLFQEVKKQLGEKYQIIFVPSK
jgi:hypothetical protein